MVAFIPRILFPTFPASPCALPSLSLSLLCLRLYRLHVPDTLRVLVDAPITREKAHTRHARDALANPLVLVLVRLVHQILGLDVAVEVVADEVIVAVVGHGVDEGGELALVAKAAAADGVEDLDEVVVEVEVAVVVGVAEVFDVFGKVAKEENVGVADFSGNLNLWALFNM